MLISVKVGFDCLWSSVNVSNLKKHETSAYGPEQPLRSNADVF